MLKNYAKVIAVLTAIATAAMPYIFAGFLLLTGRTDLTTVIEAMTSKDPIYTLSQDYADRYKVVVIPEAEKPIPNERVPVGEPIAPILQDDAAKKAVLDTVTPATIEEAPADAENPQ